MKIFLAVALQGCSAFEIKKNSLAREVFVPGKDNHLTPFKIVDFDEKAHYSLNITCIPALYCPPSLTKKVTGTGVELNEFLKSQIFLVTTQAEEDASVVAQVKDLKTGETKSAEFGFEVVKSIKAKRINNSAIFNWKFPAHLWEVLPPFSLSTLDVSYTPADQGFSVLKFEKYIELHAIEVPQNITIKVKLHDPRTGLSSDELVYRFSSHRKTRRKVLATFCVFLIAFLCIGLAWMIVHHIISTRALRKQYEEEEEERQNQIISPKPVSSPNQIVLPIYPIAREV